VKGRARVHLIIDLLLWLAAIVVAGIFDARVANWARVSGIEGFLRDHKVFRESIKAPGFFGFTAIVVLPIVIWRHRAHLLAGLFALLATATSASNQLFKWIAGRTRPFKPPDGSEQLVPFELHPFAGGKNLCFPSGHACLAFATAATLAILWPRWRWVWYALATIVAVERFMENAHWLSDTIAGAALGIGGAHLVAWLWDKQEKKTGVQVIPND
jgi:membrane-associated phospholipid phosphatase